MSGADDWLSGEATRIAFCWRAERRDGVAVALTGHDRDLVVDGVTYRAAPGMVPSAIRREGGLDADTGDVGGALSADAIRADDLADGRWDGGRVVLFATDWGDTGRRVALSEGRLGAVELTERGFTAELRGPAAALDAPVAEETSPECRAELSDRRCRVAMATRRQLARAVSGDGDALVLDVAEPVADGWGGGRLRWLEGANAGLEAVVVRSEGTTVRLRAPPAHPVTGGELVEVSEGCDRSLETCAARFNNAANFRGEPFLPGIDLITRYPGG